MVNYLEDFICLGINHAEKAVISLLDFYISYAKLQPPSQVVKYLGVLVDAVKLELRLPPEKIVKLHSVSPRKISVSHSCLSTLCYTCDGNAKLKKGFGV